MEVGGKLVSSHILKDVSGNVFHQIGTCVDRKGIPGGNLDAGENADEPQPRHGHKEHHCRLNQGAAADHGEGLSVGEHRPVHIHGDDFFHHKDHGNDSDDRADELIVFFEKSHETSFLRCLPLGEVIVYCSMFLGECQLFGE